MAAAGVPGKGLQFKRDAASIVNQMCLSGENMQYNSNSIMFSRIFFSILAGCVTGLLGLTNLSGFAAFFAMNLLVPLAFWLKMGCQGKLYFESWRRYTLDGVTSGLLSFVLFWTLSYDLVYIF